MQRFTYIFDGFYHKEPQDFFSWIREALGDLKWWISLSCKQATIEERYKAKEEGNEVTEEIAEEFQQQASDYQKACEKIGQAIGFRPSGNYNEETDCSLETTC